MDSRELDKQMNDLWRRVSGGELPPAEAPTLPADVRRGSADTMRFLRDNFSKAESEWKTLLAAKDAQLRDLSAQLDETKLHLEEVRQRLQDARENAMNQEMAVAMNLEESKKLLDAQKQNHAKEKALLKEVLERTKAEMVSMQERLEALRREREELRGRVAGLSVEKANISDEKSAAAANLGQAKEAVEKTLSELLSERRARKEDQSKIKDLEAKAAGLEKSLDAAKQNMDAERAQWREMWDRERSVWETHRQEFAVWEERLRSEREAWSLKMREQEARSVEGAAGMAAVLRDASQWSDKVTQILKLYALKGVELPKAFVAAGPAPEPAARRSLVRMLAVGLAAFLVMGAAAWQLNVYRTKVHYKLLSRAPVDLPNPSGFAVTKDGVWFSDWEKGLVLKDARSLATVKAFSVQGGVPLRPAALSAAQDGLWALDMSQLRYVRHDAVTGGITASAKSPGPAPQSAAWDGYSLWAFDAASGLLYKYSGDVSAGVAASYPLEGVKTLVCMQWYGGRLWVLGTDNVLRRYAPETGGFRLISSQALGMEAPAAFFLDGGKFWTLGKAGSLGRGYELKVYSLKSYI